MSQAPALMETVCQTYTTHFVLLFDCTSRDYTQRIVLQNNFAMDYFGPISNPYGGFNGRLIQLDEMWLVIRHVSRTFDHVGIPTSIPRLRLTMKQGEVKPFEMRFVIDPSSRLLVVVGRLIGPDE